VSRGFRNADVTVELSSQLTADALERIHAEEAAQAEHAAERRGAGQAGVCEDCGGRIEPERVEFLPDATRCVSCQQVAERS
jgi:RNA polymerase-binding transcription factor